jgi:uncharacterized protein YndB with AHSA1/START domain
MSMLAHPALVLNADFRPMSYFPLSVLSWQDAVHAVFSERASVVAEYDAWARSPSTRVRLPSVVALRKYQRTQRRVAFTRFNVFLRDRFTCQYCGKVLSASALTFEHVIPRSHGGQTTWSNIAPIDKVWLAYTTPGDIKQWNAASADWHTTAASVDLRKGGAFSSRMEAKDGSMGFDFAGTYTKIVKHKLIEYSFGDREARVTFTPGPKGVAVRVAFDSEPTHSVEQQRAGWQAILDNFARHVEAQV